MTPALTSALSARFSFLRAGITGFGQLAGAVFLAVWFAGRRFRPAFRCAGFFQFGDWAVLGSTLNVLWLGPACRFGAGFGLFDTWLGRVVPINWRCGARRFGGCAFCGSWCFALGCFAFGRPAWSWCLVKLWRLRQLR